MRNVTLCFTLLWLITVALSLGNPRVIESDRLPISMIEEKVEIKVSPKVSEIHGRYLFRQEPDAVVEGIDPHLRRYLPEEKKRHVLIYVPVICHWERKPVPPTVFVNGVKIEQRIWNDLMLGDDPTGDVKSLPDDWALFAFQYAVPLRRLKKTFEARITYHQENLPGNIAAYLPINPPKEPGKATITFTADRGYALKPFNARLPWHRSYPSLSETAQNYKLLRVKCVPQRR